MKNFISELIESIREVGSDREELLEQQFRQKMEDKYGELPGECSCCGQCCNVLSLEYSKKELADLAAEAMAGLTRFSSQRYRDWAESLDHEARFVKKHWTAVPLNEVRRLRPHLTEEDMEGRHFYSCNMLGKDGLCTMHEQRPQVCRGYPWYGKMPVGGELASECGYEGDVYWANRVLMSENPPSGIRVNGRLGRLLGAVQTLRLWIAQRNGE